MANEDVRKVEELAKDGGIKSRKLWAFVAILAAGFPLAWYDKLTAEAIAFLLGLYAVYIGGNLVAKQILTGGNVWGLLTSTKKPKE